MGRQDLPIAKNHPAQNDSGDEDDIITLVLSSRQKRYPCTSPLFPFFSYDVVVRFNPVVDLLMESYPTVPNC